MYRFPQWNSCCFRLYDRNMISLLYMCNFVFSTIDCRLYIVTYEGFAWRIIMGSGLDDWIYWHFYYNYTQFWQLTINDCLRLAPFLAGLRVSSLPLWRMPNEESLQKEFCPQLNTCFHSPYVISSLSREWVCILQLLLFSAERSHVSSHCNFGRTE
jgi:hypothetical protein